MLLYTPMLDYLNTVQNLHKLPPGMHRILISAHHGETVKNVISVFSYHSTIFQVPNIVIIRAARFAQQPTHGRCFSKYFHISVSNKPS
jgi:hypothetical protein